MREEKLVRGFSPTDVEAKVTKVYETYSMDWRITAIVERDNEIFITFK